MMNHSDNKWKKLNFTVGPVMSESDILEMAGFSTPYFRTLEFSEIMKENESLMLRFLEAPYDSRCVFLTASGTGAMEACVMNALNEDDKVIVINGGSFGQRFVDLCSIHKRNFVEVKCGFGRQLKQSQLVGLEDSTVLLVNMHETSSGLLYDMQMISDFCKENKILLVIDAISSFVSDELKMERLGADIVITGSQKALAVQPGISIIALSPNAIDRIMKNEEHSMYLSIKKALLDGERGQTPFTPAVTVLLQINKRLSKIDCLGLENERNRISNIANTFRIGIADLPLKMIPERPSNALTCVSTSRGNAKEIVRILKDEYDIWVCPNGGEYANSIFRIGHIGFIKDEDNQRLVSVLHKLNNRGLL